MKIIDQTDQVEDTHENELDQDKFDHDDEVIILEVINWKKNYVLKNLLKDYFLKVEYRRNQWKNIIPSFVKFIVLFHVNHGKQMLKDIWSE